MPFIQRATPNYFGFAPVSVGAANTNFQVTPYLVSSSAGEIAMGDVVIFTSSGVLGTIISMAPGPTPGLSSTFAMLGVAANTVIAGQGSTAATINSNSSSLCWVYDSPYQYFVGCDTSSFGIGSTFPGKTLGINTSGIVGSTGNFQAGKANARSVMVLAGNTASSGTYMFKLVGLHPVEQGVYSTVAGAAANNAATDTRKWIVIPNNHVFGFAVNTGVTTT